jgi:predicted nucleic acid-binding protein
VAVLFDSSLYISALRERNLGVAAFTRWARNEPVWLSSVVLEELYAGARSREQKLVEALERDFSRVNRILVPNLGDWVATGRILSRIAAKYGFESIRQSRLTNDGLIAMSACRIGVTVFTANERDFLRLSEFRPFQWQVRHTFNNE